jgi:hypothetical protein
LTTPFGLYLCSEFPRLAYALDQHSDPACMSEDEAEELLPLCEDYDAKDPQWQELHDDLVCAMEQFRADGTHPGSWPNIPGVYYIRHPMHTAIKIGYGDTIRRRLLSLLIMAPCGIRLLAYESAPRSAERARHSEFASTRIRIFGRVTEWFEESAELTRRIEGLSRPMHIRQDPTP